MQTILKRPAAGLIAAITLSCAGIGAATAADFPQTQQPPPAYAPPPVQQGYAYPPPAYGYPPPPPPADYYAFSPVPVVVPRPYYYGPRVVYGAPYAWRRGAPFVAHRFDRDDWGRGFRRW
jgi:hypothetical protein